MGKLIGIDHGERRFGLAMSDASRTLARPLEVVEGVDALWRRLAELKSEEEVDAFVLGLPVNMDGSLGPKAREVEEFRTKLEERLGLPVDLWDERLTTVQAERDLKSAGATRKRLRREVDRRAAQILLQSYLDRQGRPGGARGGSCREPGL